jgi:hypothetical protein
MAWTAPITWQALDLVDAALQNTHLSANMSLLATQVDTADGSLRRGIKLFAFSSGQGNTGTGDDQLTSYDVTIPAGFLTQPGDAIVVEGHYALAANTNSKQGKITFDTSASPIRTMWTTAANVAAHIVPFYFTVTYRTATTGAITGWSMIDAGSGGAPTRYLFNFGLTLNTGWTVANVLRIYAVGVADNDVVLRDYSVYQVRGIDGDAV